MADTLWLIQSGDPMKDPCPLEIDNSDAVVAEFSHKKPVTREIDGHVIDPARDMTERDLRLELERCGILGVPVRDAGGGQQSRDHRHCYSPASRASHGALPACWRPSPGRRQRSPLANSRASS